MSLPALPSNVTPLTVTVKRAVELTGWSRAKINRHLRAGDVRGVRLGGLWIVYWDSLQTFVNRAAEQPQRRIGSR